jgi:hypothetical protein
MFMSQFMNMLSKQQREMVKFQFHISKELDKKLRLFVAQKNEGFHKGDLQKEIQLAINEHLEKERSE